jgi:hypothetical protein
VEEQVEEGSEVQARQLCVEFDQYSSERQLAAEATQVLLDHRQPAAEHSA